MGLPLPCQGQLCKFGFQFSHEQGSLVYIPFPGPHLLGKVGPEPDDAFARLTCLNIPGPRLLCELSLQSRDAFFRIKSFALLGLKCAFEFGDLIIGHGLGAIQELPLGVFARAALQVMAQSVELELCDMAFLLHKLQPQRLARELELCSSCFFLRELSLQSCDAHVRPSCVLLLGLKLSLGVGELSALCVALRCVSALEFQTPSLLGLEVGLQTNDDAIQLNDVRVLRLHLRLCL
mmetsp:Transcript_83269/g.232203  ORF Transcript_83269/g.232203 Transcript_83269/m.232203 type:complete len:235 (-) Transcript_83269:283-987(-)